MPNINIYPRGFARYIEGDGSTTTVLEQGDPSVARYLREYNSQNPVNKWGYQHQVIDLAASLFGNFKDWLTLQYTQNNFLYDINLDFLDDTLTFIITGKRRLDLQAGLQLLDEFPEGRPGIATVRRMHDVNQLDGDFLENFLSYWLSHPNGFHDMICTLNVFFGNPKAPLVNAKPTFPV